MKRKRQENVKKGIRVGDYVIPKNTEYYNQLKGKEKPIIYRDLVTDKQYLYDSFSKTLTSLEHPTTREEVVKIEEGDNIVKLIGKNSIISPSTSDMRNEYILKKDEILSPAVSNTNNRNNTNNIIMNNKKLNMLASEMLRNNNNKEKHKNNNKNNNNSINNKENNTAINKVNNNKTVLGLKVSNIMEYIVLVIIIVIVVCFSNYGIK